MPDTVNEIKSEDDLKPELYKAVIAALKNPYCLLTRGGLIGVIRSIDF